MIGLIYGVLRSVDEAEAGKKESQHSASPG